MLEVIKRVRAARRPQAVRAASARWRTPRSISTSPTAIMGPGWATPRTFRIGASSLYDALLATLDGRARHDARRSLLTCPICRRKSSAPSATAAALDAEQIEHLVDGLTVGPGHRGPGRRLRHGGVLPRADRSPERVALTRAMTRFRHGADLGPARARSSTSTRPAASATRSASRSRPRSRPAAASCR